MQNQVKLLKPAFSTSTKIGGVVGIALVAALVLLQASNREMEIANRDLTIEAYKAAIEEATAAKVHAEQVLAEEKSKSIFVKIKESF